MTTSSMSTVIEILPPHQQQRIVDFFNFRDIQSLITCYSIFQRFHKNQKKNHKSTSNSFDAFISPTTHHFSSRVSTAAILWMDTLILDTLVESKNDKNSRINDDFDDKDHKKNQDEEDNCEEHLKFIEPMTVQICSKLLRIPPTPVVMSEMRQIYNNKLLIAAFVREELLQLATNNNNSNNNDSGLTDLFSDDNSLSVLFTNLLFISSKEELFRQAAKETAAGAVSRILEQQQQQEQVPDGNEEEQINLNHLCSILTLSSSSSSSHDDGQHSHQDAGFKKSLKSFLAYKLWVLKGLMISDVGDHEDDSQNGSQESSTSLHQAAMLQSVLHPQYFSISELMSFIRETYYCYCRKHQRQQQQNQQHNNSSSSARFQREQMIKMNFARLLDRLQDPHVRCPPSSHLLTHQQIDVIMAHHAQFTFRLRQSLHSHNTHQGRATRRAGRGVMYSCQSTEAAVIMSCSYQIVPASIPWVPSFEVVSDFFRKYRIQKQPVQQQPIHYQQQQPELEPNMPLLMVNEQTQNITMNHPQPQQQQQQQHHRNERTFLLTESEVQKLCEKTVSETLKTVAKSLTNHLHQDAADFVPYSDSRFDLQIDFPSSSKTKHHKLRPRVVAISRDVIEELLKNLPKESGRRRERDDDDDDDDDDEEREGESPTKEFGNPPKRWKANEVGKRKKNEDHDDENENNEDGKSEKSWSTSSSLLSSTSASRSRSSSLSSSSSSSSFSTLRSISTVPSNKANDNDDDDNNNDNNKTSNTNPTSTATRPLVITSFSQFLNEQQHQHHEFSEHHQPASWTTTQPTIVGQARTLNTTNTQTTNSAVVVARAPFTTSSATSKNPVKNVVFVPQQLLMKQQQQKQGPSSSSRARTLVIQPSSSSATSAINRQVPPASSSSIPGFTDDQDEFISPSSASAAASPIIPSSLFRTNNNNNNNNSNNKRNPNLNLSNFYVVPQNPMNSSNNISNFNNNNNNNSTFNSSLITPPGSFSPFVVYLRGLSHMVTALDVTRFFTTATVHRDFRAVAGGINLTTAAATSLLSSSAVARIKQPGGVHILKDRVGGAFVELVGEQDLAAAMSKHMHVMGTRYVEVKQSNPVDLQRSLVAALVTRNGLGASSSSSVLPAPQIAGVMKMINNNGNGNSTFFQPGSVNQLQRAQNANSNVKSSTLFFTAKDVRTQTQQQQKPTPTQQPQQQQQAETVESSSSTFTAAATFSATAMMMDMQ